MTQFDAQLANPAGIKSQTPTKDIVRDNLNPEDTAEALANGYAQYTYPTFSGKVKTKYVPVTTTANPKISIILKTRLSSYLGDYGAGRIVNTFSLFPGESTTISINTYKSSSTTTSSSENILEGYSQSAAEELEEIMSQESSSSSQETLTESLQANVSASATGSASTPMYSAEVSVSASVDTSSSATNAVQSTASNALNSTNAQSLSSSSNREVNINTTSSTTTTEGESETITRTLTNVNVGRTLNFVFRQMNQQFYTFMHLIDIQVAFYNGIDEYTEILPLYGLPTLLKKVVKPENYNEVYGKIKLAIEEIKDLNGNPIVELGFLETRTAREYVDSTTTTTSSSYAINTSFSQSYTSPEGNTFKVPGVILSVDNNVVRTDGVMCEALLGQADALDDYSKGLQEEKVREKRLANNALALENRKVSAALGIVSASDSAAAAVYDTVFADDSAGSDEISDDASE